MTVRATPHSPPRAHTAPQHPPQVSVKREDVHKAIAHLPPEKQKWANGILNSTNGPGGKSVNVTPHQLNHFLNGLDPNEKSQFLKMAGNSRVSERIDPSRISVVEEKSHSTPHPTSQAQTRPTKAENIPVNLHANGNESNGPGLHRRNAIRRPSTDGGTTRPESQAKPSAQESPKPNQLQVALRPQGQVAPKPASTPQSTSTPQSAPPPPPKASSSASQTPQPMPSTFSTFNPQAQAMPSVFSTFNPQTQAMPSTFSPFGAPSQGAGNKPQPPTLTGKPQAQIQGVQTPPSSPSTQAPVSASTTQAPPSSKPTQSPSTTQGAQAPAATQSTQANHPSNSASHNQAPAATHPESKPSIGEQFLSKMGFSSKIVAGIAAIAVGIPLLSFLFAKTSPSDTSAGTPQPVG